jgi:D-serine deaminase-like pyridoxal phosphate-dependent protein
MAAAPAGTDLLMGYPPTHGELRAYLGSAPPRGQRRHRLTLLASSVDILEEMARLARTTHRPVPLRVGLEFDSGEGRGGFHHPAQISAAIRVLRRTLAGDADETLAGPFLMKEAPQCRDSAAPRRLRRISKTGRTTDPERHRRLGLSACGR